MELDVRELLLGQRQSVACVGEEYIATMLIYCHVSVFTTLEVSKLCPSYCTGELQGYQLQVYIGGITYHHHRWL